MSGATPDGSPEAVFAGHEEKISHIDGGAQNPCRREFGYNLVHFAFLYPFGSVSAPDYRNRAPNQSSSRAITPR